MKRSEMIEYLVNLQGVLSAQIKHDLPSRMDLLLKCLEAQGMLPPETKIKEKGLFGTKVKKVNKWDKE